MLISPDLTKYKNEVIHQGFRDKFRRFFKLKSVNKNHGKQAIDRAEWTEGEPVPLIEKVFSGDIIIPVDSNGKNELLIQNQLVKNSKTFQPLLEEYRFVKDWSSVSNMTADPVNRKFSESPSGLTENRHSLNPPEEKYSVNLPDMMTEFFDPRNIPLTQPEKKQELELFFKQYAPEAFPEMGGEEKISGGQKDDFLNDQEEGSELEYHNRQRLLIELSERIWEHLKKKIKQR